MKRRLVFFFGAALCAAAPAQATVPGMVTYQGRVVVNNTNYDGTGYFKFTLSNGGDSTFWSNDGSADGQNAGTEPTSSVQLTVSKGLVAVNLGDTNIANMTESIASSVFTINPVYLEVWFSTSNAAFTKLLPNLRMTAVGYALNAATAEGLKVNCVASSNLIDGTISGSDLAPGITITTTGAVTAASFSGDGALLSNLPTNGLVKKAGDTMTGALTVGGSVSANRFFNTNNTSGGTHTLALGGSGNVANSDRSVVAGGLNNSAVGDGSFVGGGALNRASGLETVVGGGETNVASGDYASILGGHGNTADDYASTVSGGESNEARGAYSYASGYRAKAMNDGAYVWADSTDTNFSSTANNQFLIRAAGGVGIGTNNPSAQLHVNGSVRVEGVTALASNTAIKGRLDADSGPGQYVMALTSSNNAGTWFTLGNDRTNGQAWNFVSTAPGNGEGAGNLLLIPSSSGARLVLNTNGHVGVGLGITTIPTNRLHVAGTIYATSNLLAGAFLAVAPSALSPTNNATLAPATGYVLLTPSSASVTLDVTTAISSGSMIGQYLILQGNNANTTTVPDNANTQLSGPIALTTNDTLQLIWSGADWIQVGNANN